MTEEQGLWMLLLLAKYLEDPKLFEETEKVKTYFCECPQCGRKWGDEYSTPNYCPNCGVAPRKRFKIDKVPSMAIPKPHAARINKGR